MVVGVNYYNYFTNLDLLGTCSNSEEVGLNKEHVLQNKASYFFLFFCYVPS